MKARVTVTLKSGILDPQGKAIESTQDIVNGKGKKRFYGVATDFPSARELCQLTMRAEVITLPGMYHECDELDCCKQT